jgi:hypothetical protein
MLATRVADTIADGVGYAIAIKLSDIELAMIRNIVKTQWLYRIQLLKSECVAQFDAIGMEEYHTLAHLIEHQTAWPTAARILSRHDVLQIKELPFFKKLAHTFGAITIADEAKFGWENMLWRLVRPGNTDCASVHTDRWFWDLAKDWLVPSYPHERYNVWIALHTEVDQNGLMVVPNSHKRRDWKWHTEERYGQQKPVIDEDLSTLGLQLLPLASGDGVVFSHDLLHGGAPNLASSTRVSLEFTIVVPR